MRNQNWKHLYLDDVLSMPDSWEYPFFAAWDTAFHCIPLAMIDPEFAKKQLDLLTREWYMHPNGQLPAYEWNFGGKFTCVDVRDLIRLALLCYSSHIASQRCLSLMQYRC